MRELGRVVVFDQRGHGQGICSSRFLLEDCAMTSPPWPTTSREARTRRHHKDTGVTQMHRPLRWEGADLPVRWPVYFFLVCVGVAPRLLTTFSTWLLIFVTVDLSGLFALAAEPTLTWPPAGVWATRECSPKGLDVVHSDRAGLRRARRSDRLGRRCG
jgi:hypothetical protein